MQRMQKIPNLTRAESIVTTVKQKCGLPCSDPQQCPEKWCDGYLKEEWDYACPHCVSAFRTPYPANCDCRTICGDHCYKCYPPRDTKGRFVSISEYERWGRGGYRGFGPRKPMPVSE